MVGNYRNLLFGTARLSLGTSSTTLQDVGATIGGVTLETEMQFVEVECDYVPDAPTVINQKFKISIKTELAEATLIRVKDFWAEAAADRAGVYTRLDGTAPNNNERRYDFWMSSNINNSVYALARDKVASIPIELRPFPNYLFAGNEYGIIVEQGQVVGITGYFGDGLFGDGLFGD